MKLPKLTCISLQAFHVDCSYKLTSVQLSAVHTTCAFAHVHCNGTH